MEILILAACTAAALVFDVYVLRPIARVFA